jgi:hypothetical protein
MDYMQETGVPCRNPRVRDLSRPPLRKEIAVRVTSGVRGLQLMLTVCSLRWTQ